jgi:hypothetical protein
VVDALEKETLVNDALDDDMDDVNVVEYVAVDEPEVRIVIVELKAVEPDVELALCSVLLGVGEGGYTGYCHGSDFALTPPPVNSGHVQHLAPIRRTSSIFQHHSDPIPATPVAEITTSPSLRTRLPLLPSHPLVPFTVPLSRPISIQTRLPSYPFHSFILPYV